MGCDQRQVQTYSPQKLVELVKQHVQDLRQQMETLKIQLSNQEIEAKEFYRKYPDLSNEANMLELCVQAVRLFFV